MDKFEQILLSMKEMSPEDLKKTLEDRRNMCLCPGCPTYTRCAKEADEKFFCNTGKSFMCIDTEVACLCPTCPVWTDMGLKYKFFCTRSSEKAQRYENTIWGTRY
ncbi:MAG: DUF2769 domain-containing protein [Methanomicrobiales archaeon]|nr:DUF2769 domain-containing protein [Methanomicrobiales archaeon]MDI6877064.1 DUF2769 domain-containing protein [Methanomicrobiales archaeon]